VSHDTESTALAVAKCLLSVVRHDVRLDEVLTKTLADVGVESWAFTAFLAQIERTFGIEWDYDVPPATFESVRTIATYLEAAKAGVSS
jgi:acyl carrier protein